MRKRYADAHSNILTEGESMKNHKLQLDCLVILDGNGTHKTANLLREEGLNVVTMPKNLGEEAGKQFLAMIEHPHTTLSRSIHVKGELLEGTTVKKMNA